MRHCLSLVFSLPFFAKTLPFACVPTAFLRKDRASDLIRSVELILAIYAAAESNGQVRPNALVPRGSSSRPRFFLIVALTPGEAAAGARSAVHQRGPQRLIRGRERECSVSETGVLSVCARGGQDVLSPVRGALRRFFVDHGSL